MKKMLSICLCLIFMHSAPTYAQLSKQIEMFDVEKGKVVKTHDVDPAMQVQGEQLLADIQGIYKNLTPIPKKGMMVKLPLSPPVPVQNEWLNTLAEEIIIIFPEEEEPYLMMYDDEHQTYFFTLSKEANPVDFLLLFTENKTH